MLMAHYGCKDTCHCITFFSFPFSYFEGRPREHCTNLVLSFISEDKFLGHVILLQVDSSNPENEPQVLVQRTMAFLVYHPLRRPSG